MSDAFMAEFLHDSSRSHSHVDRNVTSSCIYLVNSLVQYLLFKATINELQYFDCYEFQVNLLLLTFFLAATAVSLETDDLHILCGS